MKTMHKFLAVVISAALAAGLLAGCGAASSTASSAASSEAVSSVAASSEASSSEAASGQAEDAKVKAEFTVDRRGWREPDLYAGSDRWREAERCSGGSWSYQRGRGCGRLCDHRQRRDRRLG